MPRLHVPQPPTRPGDKPDFSYVELSPRGAIHKPEVSARARDMEECAVGLVRVLDDKHEAVGQWNPRLEPEDLQVGFATCCSRASSTTACSARSGRERSPLYAQLRRRGRGRRAGHGAASGDMLFPSYRQQGIYMVRGKPLVELMCQLLSNTRDMCKGRQLPVMYHWNAGRIFSISGNLTTQFPQAVGWAMAAAIRNEDHIACTWIGEGSSAEADFHHGIIFAAVHQAPVIMNIVNNQWAISTFQGTAGGEQRSFAARGPGYGIAGIRVDGNDFLAVYAVTQWAAQRARTGGGPTLIELVTYRASAHSTSDDPSRYRPKDDYEHWPLGDPVDRLKNHLIARGEWSEKQHKDLHAELDAQVVTAWKEAVSFGALNEGPRLDRHLMFEDVYKEFPENLRRQSEQLAEEIKLNAELGLAAPKE
jgi:2-oxoisovalerate dehydrogenase E1 component alpha subunit